MRQKPGSPEKEKRCCVTTIQRFQIESSEESWGLLRQIVTGSLRIGCRTLEKFASFADICFQSMMHLKNNSRKSCNGRYSVPLLGFYTRREVKKGNACWVKGPENRPFARQAFCLYSWPCRFTDPAAGKTIQSAEFLSVSVRLYTKRWKNYRQKEGSLLWWGNGLHRML